jgi:hypothetical protein
MAQESRREQHERLGDKSYNILTKAQEDAARRRGYDLRQTCEELKQLFRERFGTDLFEWQVLRPFENM